MKKMVEFKALEVSEVINNLDGYCFNFKVKDFKNQHGEIEMFLNNDDYIITYNVINEVCHCEFMQGYIDNEEYDETVYF